MSEKPEVENTEATSQNSPEDNVASGPDSTARHAGHEGAHDGAHDGGQDAARGNRPEDRNGGTEAAGEDRQSGSAEDNLAQENAELKDRLLRTMAELENFRRRAERERQDVARYAISKFAFDCLPTVDNLERGLGSVSAEDRAAAPALEALATGMEMTHRELLATFERHGITRFDEVGVPFDHDRHEAMYEVEDPDQPAGTVAMVLEPGYLLNGRLLRPARVGVTKGGPKREKIDAPIANQEVNDVSEPK